MHASLVLGPRALLPPRLLDGAFDLGPHPDDGLGAVGETDARAPVGRGQQVGFGAEGPERGRGARVGSNGWCERERAVEVGEVGRRQEGGRRRGHFFFLPFSFSFLSSFPPLPPFLVGWRRCVFTCVESGGFSSEMSWFFGKTNG